MRRVLLSLLLLSIMLMTSLKIPWAKADPRTWIVDDDGPADFHTVTEAINAASDGDTILVKSGAYYEQLYDVSKSLTIKGDCAQTTFVRGLGVGRSTNFNISDLTIGMISPSGELPDPVFDVRESSGGFLNNCVLLYVGLGTLNSIGCPNIIIQGDKWTLSNNTIVDPLCGFADLCLWGAETKVVGNTLGNETFPARWLYIWANNDSLYHNNFYVEYSNVGASGDRSTNWDNGYPSGGNYWSFYNGVDEYCGSNQDILGSDGIGDTPVVFDEYNIDHYPLMNTWNPIETSVKVAGKDYPVTIVSNTTISQTVTTTNTLHFKSSGISGDKGYINVIFPMANTTDIKVFIDGKKLTPPPFPVINSNGTHYFIYFEFTLSSHDIGIQFAPSAPEVPVGGEWVPINRLQLLPLWTSLASTIAVAASLVGIKRIKKRQD